jgi:DNA-binding transcriptional regulator YiaG
MKAGNKYHALFQALKASAQDRVSLTFGEIEAMLGKPLPASARARQDWWGNRKEASQSAAWVEAGYHVVGVALAEERVFFEKPFRVYKIHKTGESVLWDGELIKSLRFHMGLSQAEFAEQLGVRQQTVSEWETGIYAPSRATHKYLTLVAEQAGFVYDEGDEQNH